jgi:hypothetical protein
MAIIAALKNSPWFRFPRAYWLCMALAFAVALPGLWTGFFIDDCIHQVVLDGEKFVATPYDLYCFAPGNPEAIQPFLDKGLYPWWTLPEFKAWFFRPLSSALFVLDHALWGHHAMLWHLHSILWYLLLILGWGIILRRSLPEAVGVLALILFAIDDVHWMPVVWAANRNALVATAPAIWGLLAHMRWRENGWRPGLPLSLLGYAVGLTGGETALGVLAYLGAYELFAGRDGLTRRIGALVPAGLLVLVYLAIYKIFGYGAYGSGSYIDPVAQPVAFLLNAPGRILALTATQLLAIPADTWAFMAQLRPFQMSAGVLAIALLTWLLWRSWPDLDDAERRALRWVIPGALLSMLPVAATFPANRLLLLPSFGASVAVAMVLRHWYTHRTGRLYVAAGWLLVVIHLVAAPILWPASSIIITRVFDRAHDIYLNAEIDEKTIAGQEVVMLVAPEPLTCAYPPIVRTMLGKQRPLKWHALSAAPFAHRFTRTGANSLEMEVLGGSMLTTEFEQLVRARRHPLRQGEVITQEGMTATILEMNEAGPTKVLFDFARSLDEPTFLFLVWRDNGLRKIALPPIGESLILSRENGIMGL